MLLLKSWISELPFQKENSSWVVLLDIPHNLWRSNYELAMFVANLAYISTVGMYKYTRSTKEVMWFDLIWFNGSENHLSSNTINSKQNVRHSLANRCNSSNNEVAWKYQGNKPVREPVCGCWKVKGEVKKILAEIWHNKRWMDGWIKETARQRGK